MGFDRDFRKLPCEVEHLLPWLNHAELQVYVWLLTRQSIETREVVTGVPAMAAALGKHPVTVHRAIQVLDGLLIDYAPSPNGKRPAVFRLREIDQCAVAEIATEIIRQRAKAESGSESWISAETNPKDARISAHANSSANPDANPKTNPSEGHLISSDLRSETLDRRRRAETAAPAGTIPKRLLQLCQTAVGVGPTRRWRKSDGAKAQWAWGLPGMTEARFREAVQAGLGQLREREGVGHATSLNYFDLYWLRAAEGRNDGGNTGTNGAAKPGSGPANGSGHHPARAGTGTRGNGGGRVSDAERERIEREDAESSELARRLLGGGGAAGGRT